MKQTVAENVFAKDHHALWGYAPRCFLWASKTEPAAVNFHMYAKEMKAWLGQKGFLSVYSESSKAQADAPTNPYTYSLSTIGTILARYLDDAFLFQTSSAPIDAIEAEIQRIRLYNGVVLYSARYCEAAIKQLLYCTSIPERLWKNAPLGHLLSHDCKACRKEGAPHSTSLLGSLAHRFGLCIEFEHCAMQHLSIANRRRNAAAAHSEIFTIAECTAMRSREWLRREVQALGEDLHHLMSHVSELELSMAYELKLAKLHGIAAISELGKPSRAKHVWRYRRLPGVVTAEG